MVVTDFVFGVDFTGLVAASGADHNNLVSLASPYQDAGGVNGDGKGLVLVTTDSALNTPVIPDPTVGGFAKWTRYLWMRIPHSTATSQNPLMYGWNPSATSDPTYLKWLPSTYDPSAIIALIDALKGVGWTGAMTVVVCYNTANTALTTANAANALASSAFTLATTDYNAILALQVSVAQKTSKTVSAALDLNTLSGGSASFALGLDPRSVQIFLECHTAHSTFVIGDRLLGDFCIDDTTKEPAFGVQLRANATFKIWETGNAISMRGLALTLDKTKWYVIIHFVY